MSHSNNLNMKLTLEALRILDAIARHESFAAAADELNRVPSALSYAIKKLEQDLGVTLFNRQEYRARLTPIGQNLLEGGRALLIQAQALEQQVKTGKPPEPQLITIAYDDYLSFERLIPCFQKILEERPGISLRLSAEILSGCYDALITGRADIAIAASQDIPLELASELLSPDFIPSVFVVSPDHPLAEIQEPLSIKMIQAHRTVIVSDTAQQLPKRSSGYIPGHLCLFVPTIQAKLQAQLAGLGIGFLPQYLALPYIHAGQLIEKTVDRPRTGGRLVVAWHPDRAGETVSTIIQIIKQQKEILRFT